MLAVGCVHTAGCSHTTVVLLVRVRQASGWEAIPSDHALRPFLSSLGTGFGLRRDAPLNRLTDPVHLQLATKALIGADVVLSKMPR